jgi:DNA repair and recombination protein RAD52
MTFTDKQIAELSAKLDSQHVRERSQAGLSLSYIEGWHAIAEANRIFGFGEWDRQLAALKQIGEPREVDGKHRVAYLATVRISVRAGDTTITRDGTGYGSGIDRDVGSAHESAIKEAETDAMKRALMTFGNPFGLALYDKAQSNVETKPEPDFAETLIARINAAPHMNALTRIWKDAWPMIEGHPRQADMTAVKDARKAALAEQVAA